MKYEMKYVVDRIEGIKAVLERNDKTIVKVFMTKLPERTKEGDCLIYTGKEYIFDEKTAAERKEAIDSLIDELFI